MKETCPPEAPAVLKIECPDAKGLVYKVTECLYRHELNIVANGEFVDPDVQRFFMRMELAGELDRAALQSELETILGEGALVQLPESRPKRIVVMVSKEAHCLSDILVRSEFGEMNAELLAVVGNHERLRDMVERAGYPYYYVPHEGKSREEHEQEVLEVLAPLNPDYVVLAKYMRILGSAFVKQYRDRMVNIHHSFLPAFIGANPYRQAHARGVKIIGATAHFVTENLDEGPIIEQDIFRVMHQYSPKQMANAGRNVEKHVLNRALYLVLGDRVFISGNKTVIFE